MNGMKPIFIADTIMGLLCDNPIYILMDLAQLPWATSSSRRGVSGRRNHPINLHPYPYPLDKGKAINSQIMAMRYTIAISLRTVREAKILSLTPHGGIIDATLKPPSKHLQRLGKGSKYIYKHLRT